MTRLEELEALYEEYGEAETRGRRDCWRGKHSYENPHWESGLPAMFQPESAIKWRDGWDAEIEAAAKGRAASTIPVIQHKAA